MIILTFDTSMDKMYVTISHQNSVIASKIVENDRERYHSAYLIPTIAELLKQNSLTMKDVQAIGVNIGPGSFTGIRAGVTVARVFGQNLNVPVIGVPSLEIISRINTTEKEVVCLMDARKNMAYTAVYSPSGETVLNPQAMELERVLDFVCQKDYIIVADAKMQKVLDEKDIKSLNFQQENQDFGLDLAAITGKKLENAQQGQYSWYNCKPLYIQPPPISMPKAAKV